MNADQLDGPFDETYFARLAEGEAIERGGRPANGGQLLPPAEWVDDDGLGPPRALRQIAAVAGVSHQTVGRGRDELVQMDQLPVRPAETLGADGKLRALRPADLGARPLSEVSTDPPPPLLIDRVDPEGHSILYGTGGAGKGSVASWWITQLVQAGHRVLILDYENHPTEWARRIYGLGGAAAVAGVVHAAPLTAAWGGTRGPLWVAAAEIRALARDLETDFLVVDSIVPACAGVDPMKPEAAALYAGGLEFVELPTLSLAHVTKTEDLRYPFGSAFWHNLARTTWSLKRDADRAILQHRKSNNYRNAGRFVVTTSWIDDVPREIWEQSFTAALSDRIDEVLGDQLLSVAAIVARLNDGSDDEAEPVKADSVRATLRRGVRATASRPQRYAIEGTGDAAQYRRIAP